MLKKITREPYRIDLHRRETHAMADDRDGAAELVARSREAVVTLFQQSRMGQAAMLKHTAPLVDDIIDTIGGNASAMLGLVKLRRADDYTHMHSVAVCVLMVALARQMEMDRDSVHACGMAGLLHDIGKAVVPPAILNKPGQLTRAEFEAVKLHAVAGHAMLRAAGGLPGTAIEVCLQHHERYDGTGYPAGLRGEGISLPARMAAVCDVYDAITAYRPYKAPWPPDVALRRMTEWTAEGHFDPAVFAAFARCVGPAP